MNLANLKQNLIVATGRNVAWTASITAQLLSHAWISCGEYVHTTVKTRSVAARAIEGPHRCISKSRMQSVGALPKPV